MLRSSTPVSLPRSSASLPRMNVPRPTWATVREAIRGTHQDFTQAPVGRAVVLLAVPMVLEMLMESVFVVADIFFVGRLGAEAIATVGITESLMTVIYAVAIGMSLIRSSVCCGDGGMPGRGSTYPTISRPNRSAKLGNER